MRCIAVACVVVLATTAGAQAKCKYGYKSLGGSVKTTETRSFSISPGSTLIGVTADSDKRQLSFIVYRPNGTEVCNKGPSHSLTCAFEAGAAGEYKILVKNNSGQLTSYQLSCTDG